MGGLLHGPSRCVSCLWPISGFGSCGSDGADEAVIRQRGGLLLPLVPGNRAAVGGGRRGHGQVAGLRRSDCHLLPDSRALGCDVDCAHVHVRRRANANRAWSKPKRAWVQPLDFLVVQGFDQYVDERLEKLGAGAATSRL